MQQLSDSKSIYLQIGEMIETDILRGVLLEEEQAPSTNELARRFTINPATAGNQTDVCLPRCKGENSQQAPRGLF